MIQYVIYVFILELQSDNDRELDRPERDREIFYLGSNMLAFAFINTVYQFNNHFMGMEVIFFAVGIVVNSYFKYNSVFYDNLALNTLFLAIYLHFQHRRTKTNKLVFLQKIKI